MSGDDKDTPVVPIESVVYGEVVYWITILAAILCMVGPLVAVANPSNNLLDPHLVFANIFAEEEPGGVWALSANEEPHLQVTRGRGHPEITDSVTDSLGVHRAVELIEGIAVPKAGEPSPFMTFIGELKLVRMPEGAGENEAFKLFRIRDGKAGEGRSVSARKARAVMLDVYKKQVVEDGHFWMSAPGSGDGLTQFGLALGCSVALWGLLLAAGIYMRKKVVLYALLGLWVAALVFVSAAGFVNLH